MNVSGKTQLLLPHLWSLQLFTNHINMAPSIQKNTTLIEHAKQLQNIPWCEEYEKMISGMFYNSTGPILENARMRARRLALKYNSYFPDDATPESLSKDREAKLKEMLGSIGSGCYIEPPFFIDYGCNIQMGSGVYSNFNLTILDCGFVTIGDRTMFGPGVSIFAATHETDVQSRRDLLEYAREVIIGDDCWIGGHVVIMPSVTIGNGCTIGGSSVVTKDIPAFSVAIGSPARVVKKVDPVPPIPKSA
ncbi:galactoside O-acetyltransferase [Phlyctema vagabunda]|uniref:Galactoside O-acetyltransferase n=1 Tax=Phlyctema vagabunda TaxID=108571 RepID=A0ABR4PIL2_9HELO